MNRTAKATAVLGSFLLAAVIFIVAVAQGDLPSNWDLEKPYQDATWGKVAHDWVPFVVSGTVHFDDTVQFFNNPWAEHWTGSTSQLLISSSLHPGTGDGVFKAGILQHLTGLTPGRYGFRAKILTIFQSSYMGPDAPNRDDKMFKAVGIDPTGGTDPQASTVIWSPWDGKHMEWRDLRAVAEITGTEATVFVAIDSPYPYGPYPHENAAFIDALAFVRVPTVTVTATLRPRYSIHLEWTASPAEKGYLTGEYDLAVKSDGEWQSLLERASQNSYDFEATEGVTYTFRVRAWQRYDQHGADRASDPLLLYGEGEVTIRYEDHTPPTATVHTLPVYSPERFWVSWEGSDDLSGVAAYDVQFREDSSSWQDWITHTGRTLALFTGKPGRSYGFRVRAVDYSGNAGAWPAAQVTTTVPAAGVRGRVLGPDGIPVAGAVVTGTQAVVAMPSGGDGSYGVYYTVTVTTPVTVTASSPVFAPPDPFRLTVTPDAFVPLTITMRPRDDAVCRGGFEGDTSCWESGFFSGTRWLTTPLTLTGDCYSGERAALLGAGVILSQTFSFYGEDASPVLGLWVKPITRTAPITLQVEITPTTGGTAFEEAVRVKEGSGWEFNSIPLPELSGTYTLHIRPEGASGDAIAVDAVSLGTPPRRCYLPLILREGP